jgi:hypothetical protein
MTKIISLILNYQFYIFTLILLSLYLQYIVNYHLFKIIIFSIKFELNMSFSTSQLDQNYC